MSTIVKNIKKTKHPVHKDTLSIAKKAGVLHLIPTKIPVSVSLELHDTTTELANAIRRTVNTEIDVLRLNVKPIDIKTDDRYILNDYLIKNIRNLKIEQIRDSKFKVDIKNNTNRTIDVYSKSIKYIDNKNKERPFDDTVALTELKPGKYLKINNIFTECGSVYSKNDASFSIERTCRYNCLELPKIDYKNFDDKKKLSEKIPSSMYCDPSTYYLEIPRQKYMDPLEIFKMAIKTIDKKITILKSLIERAIKEQGDGKNIDFNSEKLKISYTHNSTIFKIYEETYTIGYLLKRYIYITDPTISKVSCLHEHSTHRYIFVKVNHISAKKLTLRAIETIKKELSRILISLVY